MTRTQRIKRIAGLAGMNERIAQQRLSSSRTKHDGNLAKLAEFRRYLDEYHASFRQPGTAMNAAAARDLRRFIAQLERTIDALEAHTRRSGQECAREMDSWKRESHRASALLDVFERSLRAGDKRDEQRLQNEIDDRARPPDDR